MASVFFNTELTFALALIVVELLMLRVLKRDENRTVEKEIPLSHA